MFVYLMHVLYIFRKIQINAYQAFTVQIKKYGICIAFYQALCIA